MLKSRYKCFGLLLGALLASSPALAQPDLLFAQLAIGVAGDLEFETQVTLTNLASAAYNGTFNFWTGPGEVWNPLVGGQPILNGQLAVTLEPSQTITLSLTGTALMAGWGELRGTRDSPGLVEGNLSYLLRIAGSVSDSVGVSPSVGLRESTIPFEDSVTIGLAFANRSLETRSIVLVLRDESGLEVETVTVELVANAHISRFLNQYFTTQTLARGRVDIMAEAGVHGTAVTLVEGQISTLPMRPAAVEYSIRALADDGAVSTGTLHLETGDGNVTGFLEITMEDGELLVPAPRARVTGRLDGGDLRLTFFAGGPDFFDEAMVIDVLFSDFLFEDNETSARFTELCLSDSSVAMGTFELTRSN